MCRDYRNGNVVKCSERSRVGFKRSRNRKRDFLSLRYSPTLLVIGERSSEPHNGKGQEVRLMADMCGDENMIQSYIDGKDLYSTIASLAFDKTYEECCEFAPDGSKNPPEYKERRSQAKSIVLG